MSDRRLTSSLVAQTIARLSATGVVPRMQKGTVTDAGSRPTVVLDGTGVAVAANAVGDAPGPGERVAVLTSLGMAWVIGRLSGSQRLLGYADAVNDDPFTAQETLGGLTADVQVFQPGRVIGLFGAGQFSVDTNGAVVIGEFTWDGADNGRFFRHEFAASGVAEFGAGHAYVLDPDPGVYTATMDGTCNGGTGTFLGATTPGYLLVLDLGPLNGTMQ